jgi:hypothetical protein
MVGGNFLERETKELPVAVEIFFLLLWVVIHTGVYQNLNGSLDCIQLHFVKKIRRGGQMRGRKKEREERMERQEGRLVCETNLPGPFDHVSKLVILCMLVFLKLH